MGKSEHIYIRLQKHLNSQAVGFPAIPSGAEIKILKHIFTPEEAGVATSLSYKFENAGDGVCKGGAPAGIIRKVRDAS